MSKFKKYCGLLLMTMLLSYVGCNYVNAQNSAEYEGSEAKNLAKGVVFSTGFEDDAENSLWTLSNGSQVNQWRIGTALNNGGSKCLYISNDGGASNAYTISSSTSYVYAYRTLTLNAGEYVFSFDWKANGESVWDVLRAFLVPSNVALNAGEDNGQRGSTNTTPEGWYDVAGGGKLSQNLTWQHSSCSVDLDAGTYNLVFFWKNDNSGGTQPPAAVDNVEISYSACRGVASLHADEIGIYSATVSWTPQGEEAQWQYVLSTHALDDDGVDSATKTLVSSSTLNLQNLESAVMYFLYVRSYCSASEQSAWAPITFSTNCEAAHIPFNESFESEDCPATCWSIVYADGDPTANAMMHSNDASSNGARSFRFSSYDSSDDYNQYLISPYFEANAELILEFDYKNYNSDDYLYVGYSTTNKSVENFVWSQLEPSISGFTSYIDTLPAEAKFFAFHYYGDFKFYAWVDKVSLHYDGCVVNGLVATSVANTYATIEWDADANTQWGVVVSESEMTDEQLDNAEPVFVYENTYMADELQLGTEYHIYVRPYVSGESSCGWQSVTFTTSTFVCSAVENLRVTNVDANTGNPTFAWDAEGESDEWLVVVSTTEISDFSSVVPEVVESTTYTVSSLGWTAGDCYIYVHPNCNFADVSLWRSARYRNVADIIYECDFEDDAENSQWIFANDGQTNMWYIGTAASNGGENGLYISNDGGSTNLYDISAASKVYAYRQVNFPEAGRYRVIFDSRLDGENNYDALSVSLVPLSIEPSINSGENCWVSGWKTIFASFSNPEWTTRKTEVNVDAGSYYLVFYWQNDNSVGNQPPAAVDNIIIEKPTCVTEPVNDITVTPDYFSINIAWNGEESVNHQVFIARNYDVDFTTVTPIDVNEQSYTFNNLISGCFYVIYYRTVCGDGEYGNWNYEAETTNTCENNITHISVPTVTPTTANVIWTSDDAEVEVKVVITNDNHEDVIDTVVNGFEYLATGLNPDSRYCAWLYTRCSDGYNETFSSYYKQACFTTLPTCMYVSNFEAANATQTTVVLSWSVGDAETEWQLLVTESDDPDSAIEDAIIVNRHTYTYAGLTPGTHYNAFVRAYCSADDQSRWSNTTFVTRCDMLSLPIYESFESYSAPADCWYLVYADGNPSLNRMIHDDRNASDGYRSFRFSSVSSSRDYKQYLISSEFSADQQILFSFDYYTSTSGDRLWYGYSRTTDDVNSFRWTELPTIYDFEHFQTALPPTAKYVAFKYDGDYAYYAYVDNVKVENVSCFPVSSASVDNVEAFQATVRWTDLVSTEYHEVLVTQTDDPELATEQPIVVTGNSTIVTGLIPETRYYAYVRSYCGPDDQSIWTRAGNFETQPSCLPIENLSIVEVANTWAEVSWTGNGVATQWQILATEAGDVENATEDMILVSTTNPTITGLNPDTRYNIYVRSYCSEDDQSIWEHQVVITEPACMYPESLRVIESEPDYALVGWEQRYGPTQWQVIVSDDEVELYSVEEGDMVLVSTNSYTISNLTEGEVNYIYVRAYCSETETSEWRMVSFVTPQYPSMPMENYTQNFETGTAENWAFNSEGRNHWHIGPHANDGVGNSMFISLYYDGSGYGYDEYDISYSYAYCRLRTSIDGIAEIDFDAKNYGEYSYDVLSVFFVPEGENPQLSGPFSSNSPICSNDFHLLTISEYDEWQHWHFARPVARGSYYLIFAWRNDNSLGNQPPAAVDNISVNVHSISDENDILSFDFDGAYNVVIDAENHTVNCDVKYSSSLQIAPEIVVSDYATISPESGEEQDFTNPVVYTVTSESGISQEWTVTITRLEPSSLAEIVSFDFDGKLSEQINSTRAIVNATISRSFDITSVRPTVEVSQFATVSPVSGATVDFSNAVLYYITAEDGTLKTWTVNVAYGDSPEGVDCTNPIVVDAETELPYVDNASTEGKFNMFSTFFADAGVSKVSMPGEDVVYRLDVTNRTMVSIRATSTAELSILLTSACGTARADMIDASLNTTNASIDNKDLGPGSYYIIIDSRSGSVDYELQIVKENVCFDVDNLHVAERLQNSITVEWTPGANETSWNVDYALAGQTPNGANSSTTTSTSYTITGLAESTDYIIKVSALCDGAGISEGVTINASTISSCQKPDDIVADNVMNDGLTLSWNGFNMTQWTVEYKAASEEDYTSVTVSENSIALTGLLSSTMYDIRVRAICGAGEYSEYESISYSTSCDYISEFPFVENFDGETFPPACWKQERTAAGSGPGVNYTSGAWKRSTSQICDNSTPKIQLADTKAGSVHNLVSQPFYLMESVNGYDISIDVYRSSASAATRNEGVEVWVNSLPNITRGNPQRLGFVSKNYTVADGGIVGAEESAGCYTYMFNTTQTGVTYVILVGKSQYAGGILVDNLVVDKAEDCIAASNLSVAEVGVNDATLRWNNRNSTCSWVVEYSVDGGEYQSAELSEPELVIEGLGAETMHTVAVRIQSICFAGIAESQWYEDSVTFVTDCGVNSLPYAQNFDDMNQLPYCWESLHWNGANDVQWNVVDNQAYLPVSASTNTTLLISSKLHFTSDNDYLLDFDVYRTRQNVSNPDTLMVYYSSTKSLSTASLMGRVVMQNAQVNGNENVQFDFPALYGDYYVIFAAVGMRSFQIDNVKVRGLSSEADILSFSFAEQTSEAVIDAENKTVSVDVDFGTDLTSLVPTFTISPYATVDYQSGAARDFSSSVVYNVTSENGLYVNSWTVNVAIDVNACPNPSANDISLVADGDSVEITISRIYNETSYNLKVASEQIDPENDIADFFDGMIASGDTVLHELASHAEYHVYVQSNCGTTRWTEKTFTTSCGIYELPYEEDFAASIDLDCWSVKDANADGNTWNIANGYARYSFSRTQAANDYLVSPVFPIENHTKFKFNYYVGNFSYPETFSTYVISEGDTVLIASKTATNESAETFGPIDISQFAGRDAQIAIRCHSEAYMYRLYIDDFSIKTSEFEILSSVVGRGTITPEGVADALSGDTINYVINPLNGNELVSLMLDNRDVTADIVDNVYQLANIHATHTLLATFTENYVITASASNGGHISPSGDLIYPAGETVTFALLPDEGYRIGSVIVDGEDITSSMTSNTYSFEAISDDHTISVNFSEIIYYAIEATAGEHGSITPSGTIMVEEGTDLTFVVTPDEGYRVAAFEVDGVETDTYTLENVSADHTVNVTFEEAVFRNIAASCGENGTITPSGDVAVDNGDDMEFTIVPNAGYHISTVLVDGVDKTSMLVGGVYTFRNVTADHTIYADFEINTYTISSYARGGTITPNGSVSVVYGESMTFQFAPDDEYELANVIVDNRTVTVEDNTYTFENVSANHTIVVVFTPMNITRYNITATAGDHGSISPDGIVRVVEGGSQQFDITPDEHYYISSIAVDGSPVDVAESYMFNNVMADHTIAVEFAAYQHTITATAGDHGTISPSGATLVDEGTDATFTLIPDRGYRVAGVELDGESVAFENDSYTIENVLEDHSINVRFEIIPIWTITAASSNNGTISPSGTQYVVDGESMTFAFTPAEGYVVERVVVDGQSRVTDETSYTFENVTSDHYIYVAFRTFVYNITATAGDHGEISPAGNVEVLPGEDQLFTFVPDMGYRVDSVFVDGVSVAFDNNQYLFENVEATHTIHVTFVHIEVLADEVEIEKMSLYPNPNNGAFSIDFVGMNGNAVYQLVDIRGALLDEREVYVEDGSTIEMSYDLKPGTYFVRFISEDKVMVERFIVR